jgi:putative endonuclease
LFVIPEGNPRFAKLTTAAERRATMPTREYQFWVYILSNRSHILYIGVTNGLRKRITQHRRLNPGTFTARYKVTRLVYCEQFQYINNAIAREKELKH